MKAVHVTRTTFENESRILKESASILSSGLVTEVNVLASSKQGLKQKEILKNGIVVRRNNFYPVRRLRQSGFLPGILYEKAIAIYWSFILLFRIKPDIVIVHYVGLINIAWLKRFKKKIIFIYDAHELETEVNGLSGNLKLQHKELEKAYINNYDHVFVVSKSIESWYRSEYKLENVTTIMNCPKLRSSNSKENLFREKFDIKDRDIIYLYQGGLHKVRGIELILDAFKEINDSKYSIVFMGFGECEEIIQEAAGQFPNIYYHPIVPPDIVLNYTSSADIGIHMIYNTCLSHEYSMPNKIFEYLQANLPCIFPNLKEMKAYAEGNGIGIVLKGYEKSELIKAIMSAPVMYDDLMAKNIIKAKKEFNWNTQEIKLLEVYRNILNN